MTPFGSIRIIEVEPGHVVVSQEYLDFRVVTETEYVILGDTAYMTKAQVEALKASTQNVTPE